MAEATATDTNKEAPMLDVSTMNVDDAVDAIIGHAVGMNASDLFFLSNESYVGVQVRHLGIIRQICIVGADQGKRFMQHIKANAGMEITEARTPHDGRWIYDTGEGVSVDLRINIIPTMYGEDYGIRLLVRESQLFDLENVGMHDRQSKKYNAMLDSPGGLILITGPSGSGKTGTLYASLRRLNDGTRKINTIEDPIEFSVEGLRQSQVSESFHLSFSDLLRSVLRQNPDVIMVGEIRDPETAQTAVRAANSGHMVFSTLHAPVAAAAIQSMLSLGVHPHFLATSLRGVISQRLVRTLCPDCRMEFDISHSPNTFDEVKPFLKEGEGKVLYAPKGCEKCKGSGYRARSGVFEVMEVSKTIRGMVAEAEPARNIRAKAIEEGMLDFRKAAMLKVAHGVTSTEEVFRVIPSEHLLLED